LIRRGIRTIFWMEWVIELFRTSSDLALWVYSMCRYRRLGDGTPEGENSFRVGQSADWPDVSDT